MQQSTVIWSKGGGNPCPGQSPEKSRKPNPSQASIPKDSESIRKFKFQTKMMLDRLKQTTVIEKDCWKCKGSN